MLAVDAWIAGTLCKPRTYPIGQPVRQGPQADNATPFAVEFLVAGCGWRGAMASAATIPIVGYACRLPGASDSDKLWTLLKGRQSAVGRIDSGRFPTSPYFHPDRGEAGKSYSFAAGTIDDPWGFDAAAFGISPREAIQIDPQQRHLLETAFDALGHAGIRPSSLSGGRTGVYVGASSLDYGTRFVMDPSAADVHMMTGNTLSLVANRISYVLGLHGPSLAVDTACSSSLVALSLAADAINRGEIDTAIVGAVNLLLSPFPFIGFSRASMLSRAGQSRPFDADADGYVRAEGAVVFVLRSEEAAKTGHNRVWAEIVGWGVGQDGRTTGVSLPSAEAQQGLLKRTYDLFSLDPRDLAFVEAHGTGTPTGDPIEADALGRALGWARRRPLGIGSIKSNVGHLEPAAGLAGALKAVLALEHGELPASINFVKPNPNIPFEDLNLQVATTEMSLPTSGRVLAGVNSFGFGGTIAHVVLRRPEPARDSGVLTAGPLPPLLLSAHSASALNELKAAYARKWPNDDVEARSWIDASAYSRDTLGHRLVIEEFDGAAIRAALQRDIDPERAGASSGNATREIRGEALGNELPVCFVFAGNGSQWAGMGRVAWEKNVAFRAAFEEIDSRFGELTGRQLRKDLFAIDLDERLRRATVSQPLLFAIQYAIVQALSEKGLAPTATLGHSVGEIAAAWAAGALTLDDAIRVVHARSNHQERARGSGSMVAALISAEEADAALKRNGLVGLEIAAINSPRSITLSGPNSQLEEFLVVAETRRWSTIRLDLDYPFHSGLVDPVRQPLLLELDDLQPRAATLAFFSTVTGKRAKGEELDGEHWWLNVRQPVAFSAAARAAIDDGYQVFVEIGPKSVLGGYLRDNLRECGVRGIAIESLTEKQDEESADPIATTVAKAFVSGARIDFERLFGPVRGSPVVLPSYPWQHKQYKIGTTTEANDAFLEPASPLLGTKPRSDADVWFGKLDTSTQEWLADHRVGETVLFPAAAFAAVMLAAAADLFATNDIEVRDLDIFQPLAFASGHSVETMTRVTRESGAAEFLSRPRLVEADWTLHAKAILARRYVEESAGTSATSFPETDRDDAISGEELYKRAVRAGFDYGPCFRRVERAKLKGRNGVELALSPMASKLVSETFLLDLTGLDAAMHGLLSFGTAAGTPPREARLLPVRFGRLRLLAAGAEIAQAGLTLIKQTERSATVDIDLKDDNGVVVAEVRGLRFAAAPGTDLESRSSLLYETRSVRLDRSGAPSTLDLPTAVAGRAAPARAATAAGCALLETACLRLAWDHFHANAEAGAAVEDGEDKSAAFLLRSAALWALEARGLAATQNGFDLAAAPTCNLPPLFDTIQRLVNDHPTFGLEAACVAHLGETLPRLLTSRPGISTPVASAMMARQLATGSAALSELRARAVAALRAVLEEGSKDRVIRLLCIGADQADLMSHLAGDVDGLEVVVADNDEHRLAEAEAGWEPTVTGVAWRSLAELAEYEAGRFDLAVAVDSLHRIAPQRGNLEALRRVLRPKAPLLVAELAPSLFWDLMRGEAESWWQRTANARFPVSALLPPDDWKLELVDAGFDTVGSADSGIDATIGTMLVARNASSSLDEFYAASSKPRVVLDGIRDSFADRLMVSMVAENRISDASRAGDAVSEEAEALPSSRLEKIWYAPLDETRNGTETLSGLLDLLAAALRSESPGNMRLWVVARSARLREAWSAASDPLWCALQAAVRVARNEYPDRQISCLALDPALSVKQAADALAGELENDADDVEIVLGRNGRRVFRAHRGPAPVDSARVSTDYSGIRLERPATGSAIWREFARREPGPDEVEIGVEATGLNFRDVMWSLGLLPDEALEGGYAGATLGMECAGRLTRVGSAVTGLRVGDHVVGLAPAAFATHAFAPCSAVVTLPDGASSEAASTLPVAFLTAWYALLHLGNLAAGESVLIHGAAGGVGLAALQIARHRGAKVFATAGTPEKRALLAALDADHVLDSRNIRFADQIMELTGRRGVDMVLNSLAGDAMVQSLECLAPFGRFLEIGKRDFYLNSRIGLRAFRDNISYHAIDVDRLINRDAALARRILQDVLGMIASGELKVLPYRTFEGTHSDEAFRAMQRSQHIGKIVIQPPRRVRQVIAERRFAAAPDGLHVVAGGLGGFGLATVRWLASRGARHFLLIGRRAVIGEEERWAISELEGAGVDVAVQAVDITDGRALIACLRTASLRRPIRGVVHAAMVLDDRLIAGLDHAAIERVVAPKVSGALNLDRATEGMPLDYFLMFSSATSLIGNPGQYNYVGANAFLEGLAHQRREAGLPVTAVAWGAIGDAGYLARHAGRSDALRRRLGAHLLGAQAALDQLDALLAPGAPAVAVVARIDWRLARRELATVRTPTFGFVAPASAMAISSPGLDVLADLGNLPADRREEILVVLVRAEIGRALRVPAAEVSLATPLAAIGMDSLMMMELRTTMEAQLGIELPMMALANGLTPMDVVRRLNPLFAGASESSPPLVGTIGSLAGSHIESGQLPRETYVRSAREVARRSSAGERKL